MTTTNPATAFELRNYTLHPGQRDALITLFEREFIEPQQDCGITLTGLFTDMDRPDHFVWLRGFADMAARPAALAGFYTGPIWQANRDAANATMVDSDDVLLLKPFGAPLASGGKPGQLFLAIDCRLVGNVGDVGEEAAIASLENAITAHLDGDIVGRWITDATPNNFPRLPVREGERHAVWLLRLPQDLDSAGRAALVAALEPGSEPQLLRLQPTTRSALQLDPGAPRYIGRPGDFDFLVGRWTVRNRRLMTRLRGNTTDWREFDALIEAWTHMSGQVSFDEIHFESEGFSGATMRSLDMQTRQWSIYWINSRSGKVFPPVQGGWCGARGEFYGVDEDDGRTVLVRFVWERLSANALRWTQAFSIDGGRSWEDNWRMEMSRL